MLKNVVTSPQYLRKKKLSERKFKVKAKIKKMASKNMESYKVKQVCPFFLIIQRNIYEYTYI